MNNSIGTYEEEAQKMGEGACKILEKHMLKYLNNEKSEPVNMKHLRTPIPKDYVRKRSWDYCIKSLSNGSFRLIRGADLLTIMEAIKLEKIEEYIQRLRRIHPHLTIENKHN